MPAARTVQVRGGSELTAAFTTAQATLAEGMRRLVRSNAEELRRRIQARAMTGFHAPGAPHIPGTGPGPNVATGDYVNSWQVRVLDVAAVPGGLGASGTVYTTAPQANRLEYGFVGADRLGRTYNQRPYPHMQPAADEIETRIEAQAAAMLDLVLRGVR